MSPVPLRAAGIAATPSDQRRFAVPPLHPLHIDTPIRALRPSECWRCGLMHCETRPLAGGAAIRGAEHCPQAPSPETSWGGSTEGLWLTPTQGAWRAGNLLWVAPPLAATPFACMSGEERPLPVLKGRRRTRVEAGAVGASWTHAGRGCRRPPRRIVGLKEVA
jgi:hypothetical protein